MKCRMCGKEFERNSFGKPYEYICSSNCFSDYYWLNKIEQVKILPSKNPIINGNAYYVGTESAYEKGFGGQKFQIKFNSGETITTTNLSHNGIIPFKFRTQLPDNAVFVK